MYFDKGLLPVRWPKIIKGNIFKLGKKNSAKFPNDGENNFRYGVLNES